MSCIVIDASIAAKWFLAEEESRAAIALLHGPDDLVGPELLRVETAAAIVRRLRLGGLSEVQTEQLLADAHAAFKLRSITLRQDMSLLPRAEEMAISLRHPLQVCLYLACAEASRCDLVTTDSKLVKRASASFPFVRRL